AGAAGRGGSGRISAPWITRVGCAQRRSVSPRLERNRLCRRPQRGDRVSLGAGPIRPTAGASSRSGPSPGHRHRRMRHIRTRPRSKGGNLRNTDRFPDRRRPGPGRPRHLNRPGRNVTGVSRLSVTLEPKRLELLRELSPKTTVIGLLVNPSNPRSELVTRQLEGPARALGLRLQVLKATSEGELDTVFASLVRLGGG